jgi:hypothetical protein
MHTKYWPENYQEKGDMVVYIRENSIEGISEK